MGDKITNVQEMPEKMKGTRYEEMWNSNPWINMGYEPSFWDKIKSFFGGKTQTDRDNETIANNAQLYYAQLLQAMGEEEYNSAPEQVKRDLKAGINPDLANNITPGEATEFDNQASNSGMQGTEGLGLIEGINKTVQRGIEIGAQAIGLLNSGVMAVVDGMKAFEEAQVSRGTRDQQIVSGIDALFDDMINKDGELYLPGIGTVGKINKVNEDGEGDTLDSVTVVPKLTWKEWNNNGFVRSRYQTLRERKVAWNQVLNRLNSYMPTLPATKKEETAQTAEYNIGKLASFGENRAEVKQFYKIINDGNRDVRIAINQFNKDYYNEMNAGSNFGYRNENGNWVKVEAKSGGAFKAMLEKGQMTLDKKVVELETKVMHTYQNILLNIDEQINNAQTLPEKYFWMYCEDKFFNHINRSKNGQNTTMGDTLKGLKGFLEDNDTIEENFGTTIKQFE